jgi:hypothetical protein
MNIVSVCPAHDYGNLSALASTMLRLAYGYRLKDEKDAFFTEAQLSVSRLMDSMMLTSELFPSSDFSVRYLPGFDAIDFYVNIFPGLKYVSEWVPGARWKRTAREWKRHRQDALKAPYEWTKSQVVCLEFWKTRNSRLNP